MKKLIEKLIFKIVPKKLRGNDPDTGFLQLPGTWLDYGYQKHGFAIALGIMPFFFLLQNASWLTPEFIQPFIKNGSIMANVVTGIIASLYGYAVGWIFEFYQKFTKKGVYDPWDAHVMLFIGLFLSFWIVMLLILIKALGWS